ncbi:unnamed protein product [Prorocentrum cordatum]|uniref:Uncharacterized protein n=1 Tax=Prorocentrum cordatum TaxID=2364126 RepID=A0ABN9VQH4_9DINO|nr:unnamed protein product [Polarella glacialis]
MAREMNGASAWLQVTIEAAVAGASRAQQQPQRPLRLRPSRAPEFRLLPSAPAPSALPALEADSLAPSPVPLELTAGSPTGSVAREREPLPIPSRPPKRWTPPRRKNPSWRGSPAPATPEGAIPAAAVAPPAGAITVLPRWQRLAASRELPAARGGHAHRAHPAAEGAPPHTPVAEPWPEDALQNAPVAQPSPRGAPAASGAATGRHGEQEALAGPAHYYRLDGNEEDSDEDCPSVAETPDVLAAWWHGFLLGSLMIAASVPRARCMAAVLSAAAASEPASALSECSSPAPGGIIVSDSDLECDVRPGPQSSQDDFDSQADDGDTQADDIDVDSGYSPQGGRADGQGGRADGHRRRPPRRRSRRPRRLFLAPFPTPTTPFPTSPFPTPPAPFPTLTTPSPEQGARAASNSRLRRAMVSPPRQPRPQPTLYSMPRTPLRTLRDLVRHRQGHRRRPCRNRSAAWSTSRCWRRSRHGTRKVQRLPTSSGACSMQRTASSVEERIAGTAAWCDRALRTRRPRRVCGKGAWPSPLSSRCARRCCLHRFHPHCSRGGVVSGARRDQRARGARSRNLLHGVLRVTSAISSQGARSPWLHRGVVLLLLCGPLAEARDAGRLFVAEAL